MIGDDGSMTDSEAEAEEWKAIEADRFLRGLDRDSNLKLEGNERGPAWKQILLSNVVKQILNHLIIVINLRFEKEVENGKRSF